MLLCILVFISLFQILIRRRDAPWPWHLIGFAQGLSIISRLMMLMPHATAGEGGIVRFDGLYVSIAVVSMVFSAVEIWFCELPEVRRAMLSETAGRTPGKPA